MVPAPARAASILAVVRRGAVVDCTEPVTSAGAAAKKRTSWTPQRVCIHVGLCKLYAHSSKGAELGELGDGFALEDSIDVDVDFLVVEADQPGDLGRLGDRE